MIRRKTRDVKHTFATRDSISAWRRWRRPQPGCARSRPRRRAPTASSASRGSTVRWR